jgi:ribosome-binding factor A
MSKNKRTSGRAEPPCDLHDPDDGLDSRERSKRHGGERRDHRKTGQLCRQVFRALSLALSELESGSSWAWGLTVDAVDPAPNAARLRVTISFGGTRALDEALEALCRLQRLSGRLRAEVAASITRKKAPELIFELAAPEEVSHG